jgi:hypothetical protein
VHHDKLSLRSFELYPSFRIYALQRRLNCNSHEGNWLYDESMCKVIEAQRHSLFQLNRVNLEMIIIIKGVVMHRRVAILELGY